MFEDSEVVDIAFAMLYLELGACLNSSGACDVS